MNILKFPVNKTARVFYKPGTTGKCLVFLHGYAMNIDLFHQSFQLLEQSGHTLIFPEGLSRFYLKRTSGMVVASWMTKEDRMEDIENNNNYLDRLIAELLSNKVISSDDRISVTGFSQGGATAARWAFMGTHEITDLFLWGSNFPPDIPINYVNEKRGNIKVNFVLGDDDEYLTVDEIKKEILKVSSFGIKCDLEVYRGTHKICDAGLKIIQDLT
jgi:predicted esterase